MSDYVGAERARTPLADRYRLLYYEAYWAEFIGLTPTLSEFLNHRVPDGWRVVAVLPKDKGADVVIERE